MIKIILSVVLRNKNIPFGGNVVPFPHDDLFPELFTMNVSMARVSRVVKPDRRLNVWRKVETVLGMGECNNSDYN